MCNVNTKMPFYGHIYMVGMFSLSVFIRSLYLIWMRKLSHLAFYCTLDFYYDVKIQR